MMESANIAQQSNALAMSKWQREAMDALDAYHSRTPPQEKSAQWNGKAWQVGDYVSGMHEGDQVAGLISDFRRDVRNGAMCAWIELAGPLPGMFLAVPLSDLL